MFVGAQVHQKDDNNRIRIPQMFRAELGTSFYFAKGGNGAVHIYTQKYVDDIFEKINQALNPLDENEVDEVAKYSAGFKPVSEDKQGRVTIPEEIVSYGNLGRDLKTVGIGNLLVVYNVKPEDEQTDTNSYTKTLGKISEIIARKNNSDKVE